MNLLITHECHKGWCINVVAEVEPSYESLSHLNAAIKVILKKLDEVGPVDNRPSQD